MKDERNEVCIEIRRARESPHNYKGAKSQMGTKYLATSYQIDQDGSEPMPSPKYTDLRRPHRHPEPLRDRQDRPAQRVAEQYQLRFLSGELGERRVDLGSVHFGIRLARTDQFFLERLVRPEQLRMGDGAMHRDPGYPSGTRVLGEVRPADEPLRGLLRDVLSILESVSPAQRLGEGPLPEGLDGSINLLGAHFGSLRDKTHGCTWVRCPGREVVGLDRGSATRVPAGGTKHRARGCARLLGSEVTGFGLLTGRTAARTGGVAKARLREREGLPRANQRVACALVIVGAQPTDVDDRLAGYGGDGRGDRRHHLGC
jgi:hypothetical protein